MTASAIVNHGADRYQAAIRAARDATQAPGFAPVWQLLDNRLLMPVAIHEAAHAVAAVAAGIAIDRVFVGFGYTGEDVGAVYPNTFPESVDVNQRVVYLLAAGVAERRYLGLPPDGHEDAVWDARDRQQAESILARRLRVDVTSAIVTARLAQLRVAARRAVDRHWAWIERVALELVDRRVMSGADVARLRPAAE